MKTRAAAAALCMAVTVSGCSSASRPASNTPSAPDPYAQTWKVPYGATTCTQWLDDMTAPQRFTAAHDMVIALKAFNQSDAFARSFESDVTTGCQPAPSMKMAEVAAGIATLATKDFP